MLPQNTKGKGVLKRDKVQLNIHSSVVFKATVLFNLVCGNLKNTKVFLEAAF